jgi:mannan endo-1,4-beta-mannosidase
VSITPLHEVPNSVRYAAPFLFRLLLQPLWLLFAPVAPASAATAESFRVINSGIIGPDGKPFVPIGANLNGSEWGWNAKTAPLAELAAKTWKLNTIRLNCNVPGVRRSKYPTYEVNNDEGAVVAAYTALGVVVILEAHNWTGSYPTDDELPALIHWHVERAQRFKENPRVWFNIMNEPGGEGPPSPQWLDVHQKVIRAIRGTGAGNIIVCDGASWGQDIGAWDDEPVRAERSGILTFGPHLARAAGGEFENVCFSINTYDQWVFGDEKLRHFLREVHERRLALFIGEPAHQGTPTNAAPLPKAAIGSLCPWALASWPGMDSPGDGFALCKGKEGGLRGIDDPVAPTNLNWHGQLLWQASHRTDEP